MHVDAGPPPVDYLVAACEAHGRVERAPSLLPRAAEHRLVAWGG